MEHVALASGAGPSCRWDFHYITFRSKALLKGMSIRDFWDSNGGAYYVSLELPLDTPLADAIAVARRTGHVGKGTSATGVIEVQNDLGCFDHVSGEWRNLGLCPPSKIRFRTWDELEAEESDDDTPTLEAGGREPSEPPAPPAFDLSALGNPAEFWLGGTGPHWATSVEVQGPIMLAIHRFGDRRSAWPRARVPVAIDSGAFTAIEKHGRHVLEPEEYAAKVSQLQREMGIAWAATQDWLVTPRVLARTGLDVREHQQRTVASFAQLRRLAPLVPWVPALHGRDREEYLEHLAMYFAAGVKLEDLPLVGLGSIAYRQGDPAVRVIAQALVDEGLRLHGFGVKMQGAELYGDLLVSADSASWSRAGRWESTRPGSTGRDSKGRLLANSMEYAEAFRERMQEILARSAPRLSSQTSFAWESTPC